MIYRILSTVLIALLALTACDTEPAPPDLEDGWCYIYSFGGAAENSAGVPMTISAGQVGTGGLETVGGQLNLSFTENFYFRPEWIYIRLQRAELASSFNVSVSGNVFGVNIARSETIPADLETIHAQYDNPNPNSLEGNAVNVSITSGAKLVVEFVQIYGTGHNPYPRDDCAPITPEATPTETPEITNTPTGGPTPEPCNTVIWDFEGTPQGWELIRNPSWSNSIWAPNLAQDFVHVPTGGVGGGYIGDGNQHGTSTVRRGIGAGIYDLNLAGSCNVESMQIYWRSNGSSNASVRMRLLVDGSWFDPTVPGNWFGFGSTGGTVAWRTYDFESRGYTIPLNAIEAIEFGSYEWYETQIFEVRINPQGPSGPTATPTASPSATIDPTIAAMDSACVGTTQPTERSISLYNWTEVTWPMMTNAATLPLDIMADGDPGFSAGYISGDVLGFSAADTSTIRGMNYEHRVYNPGSSNPYSQTPLSVIRVAVQYTYTRGHDVTSADNPRLGVRANDTGAITWGARQAPEGGHLVTYLDFDTPQVIKGLLFQGVTDRRIDAVSPDGYLGLYRLVFCIREAPDTTPTPTTTPMIFPTLTATVTPFVLPTVTAPFQFFTPTPYPTITPAPSRTNTPPPTITPIPPSPMPSVTPGPTNTPPPTLTPFPMPTQADMTTTPLATYPGPRLTPIPGGGTGDPSELFGTPARVGTPTGGEFEGRPDMEATYLPTPNGLGEFYDDARDSMGTAVAYVNDMPSDFTAVMPDTSNVSVFAGYFKYAISSVNMQEIFGITVYPIVQHAAYAFLIVFFVTSARVVWRLVLVFIKFAIWIIRWILKVIPGIGG